MANQLTSGYEDNSTSFEGRSNVEALGQSLISLQLRQENDKLRQAIDVLCQAHASLSEDLTLKNNEIAQLESCRNDFKLQAAELSEKVNLLELELAEYKEISRCARNNDLLAHTAELQHKLELTETEKDHDSNYVLQQIVVIRETLLALQHELQHELSEEAERKQQMKKLKKEAEDLKEIVTAQNGAIADAQAAKEECDKQIASLQLQTEHVTSEKVTLVQQLRILEDCNVSLRKDHARVTDSYEAAQKLSTELQLRVAQLCDREQSLSELLQQRDEVIQQLISEKEEVSPSVSAVKLKVDSGALERTAHTKQISELEKQISAVKDQNKKLSAEKQVLLRDNDMRKELTEQLKQSFSDSERENERCQKVISDFEEQHIQWKGEKLHLEGCIISNMEIEVQAVKENQNLERSIDELPSVRNTENVEVLYNNLNDADDQQKLQKCEFIRTLEAAEVKSETSETEKNVNSACDSVHNPCCERDRMNLRACQSLSINLQDEYEQCETEKDSDSCVKDVKAQLGSLMGNVSLKVEQTSSSRNEFACDMQAEVDQIHSSEKLPSETEQGSLQSVVPRNAAMQENKHSQLVSEGYVKTVDASNRLLEKSVVIELSGMGKNKQHTLNLVADSEKSLAVSDICEGSNSVARIEGGFVKKDQFNTKNVVQNNDPLVKTARDSSSAVADAADKHKKRRVIKRFTRLAALRHDCERSSVHGNSVPIFDTQAACSRDLNTPVEAVEHLPDNEGLQSNEASASNGSEATSVKLQENTGDISSSVSAVSMAADEPCSTDVCSVDIHPATVAISKECSSACEKPSCLQAVGSCSEDTSGSYQQNNEHRDSYLNTEMECATTLNTIVENDMSSDNKSKLSQHVPSKRLNADVSSNVTKKFRSG